MENYLNENFGGVKPKHSSDEVLQKWRDMCGLVMNPKRRFRFTANIEKRNEATNHLGVAVLASKAALHLLHPAEANRDTTPPEDFKADDASTIDEGHNPKKLKLHDEEDGRATKLKISTTNGLAMDDKELATREELYGLAMDNKELANRHVIDMNNVMHADAEANRDTIVERNNPENLKLHDEEDAHATKLRACTRQELYGTNEFTVCDQQGFWEFVWGALVSLIFSTATEGWPCHGSHDGLGIVASIFLLVFARATCNYRLWLQFRDLNTEKRVATLTEGGNDETGWLVNLKRVATIIGKIGLIFAIVTFAVFLQKLLVSKIREGTQWSWSDDDNVLLLEYFAIVFIIVVFVALKDLTLAVKLSLAFVMMKMMDDKTLAHHLAETKEPATSLRIQKVVKFQFSFNIVPLIVRFTSACLIGRALLNDVQLLWVNMIMDTLGALALATEPPNDELMKRAPVGRKGNFISNVMWRNIFGQAVYQFAVIWLLQSKGKSFFGLDGDDSDLILNTLIFNCFVFCQLFNKVNSREMEKENVLDDKWKNKVFVSVIAATVIFQVIIIEYLGTFANTSPLTPTQWLFSIFTGFLSMPIAVFLKKIPV